ncbi:hypothetical protein AAF712_012164 [Marasmius tenuissimus]|uniref:YDG domain-containing protein n=1 Tax=Marasmius tenuissimus TaxID=585030 RepID=A0ABR2ZI48_9AGAR
MARHVFSFGTRKSSGREYAYGPPKHPVGTVFNDRATLHEYMVHGPLQAGIHGHRLYGTYSIVISGGYEDDEDHGDWFWYTGEGGRNDGASTQVKDQSWKDKGNNSLKMSLSQRKPVRVIRGHVRDSPHGPAEGFRYDGLYTVMELKTVVGKSGFKVCKALFKRLKNQAPLPPPRWQVNSDKTPDNDTPDDETPEDEIPEVIEIPSDSEDDTSSHSESDPETDSDFEIVSVRRAAPLATSSINILRKRTRDDHENDSDVVRKVPKTSYTDLTCTLPEKSNINGRRTFCNLPKIKKNK